MKEKAIKKEKSKVLSVIVPCYNEEEAIPFFYDEITKTATEMKSLYDLDFEFIFVDDGSKDATIRVIKDLRQKDERVHYVSFSRNFGKEAAIYAGLENSTGDFVTLMDADLQDPPSLLPEMYESIVNEGYDCVATKRSTRKGEPKIRSFFARLFYKLINKISNTEIVDGARDYRLMTRAMVDSILKMSEVNRFSKGIFSWVGFKTKWIDYENVERVAGKTKWSFRKLFKYSLDGIFAFSTAPLAIASFLGFLFCFVGFILIVVVVVKKLVWGDPVQGYASLMCVITFIGGLQLFCLGILGQYISKMFYETKKRPIYIAKEKE